MSTFVQRYRPLVMALLLLAILIAFEVILEGGSCDAVSR